MERRSGKRLQGGGSLLIGIGLIVLLVAGCGYHFAGGGGETFQPHIRTVYVEAFANQTSEASAENLFRSAFNSEIVRMGRFKLAAGQGEADALFRGTILSLTASPLAYKTSNLSAEDRLTVVLSLSLEETASGKVLWATEGFSATGDYRVTSVGVTEISRRNALTKLASDAAERAYRAMIADF
jgi:hypothetical protein